MLLPPVVQSRQERDVARLSFETRIDGLLREAETPKPGVWWLLAWAGNPTAY